MKVLKYAGIVLGLLIAGLLVASFILKKSYNVSREIMVEQPRQLVFDYMKYLKNQDNYSVWNQMDPLSKKTYTGEDATVGFISAWDSQNKNVGAGEQEIKSIKDGESIETELRFKRPFESKSLSSMSFTSVDSLHTKVVWSVYGDMKWPSNLMQLFMSMDKMLGADLQNGLENAKKLLVGQANATSEKK